MASWRSLLPPLNPLYGSTLASLCTMKTGKGWWTKRPGCVGTVAPEWPTNTATPRAWPATWSDIILAILTFFTGVWVTCANRVDPLSFYLGGAGRQVVTYDVIHHLAVFPGLRYFVPPSSAVLFCFNAAKSILCYEPRRVHGPILRGGFVRVPDSSTTTLVM